MLWPTAMTSLIKKWMSYSLLTLLSLLLWSPVAAQAAQIAGLAWDVQGNWHADGSAAALATADLVVPGAVLQADSTDTAHSVTILMPDGQRLLCQCFDSSSCARGFRVPALLEEPQSSVRSLFDALQDTVRHHRSGGNSAVGKGASNSAELQAEAVLPINSRSEIDLAPYLAKLPRGPYRLSFQRVGPDVSANTRIFNRDLSREGNRFPILGPGLYEIGIVDPLHYSREHLYVLAISGNLSAAIASSFIDVERCLSSWDDIAPGWPVHELQRLYLEALAREHATLP
jgi:hypothetical protein